MKANKLMIGDLVKDVNDGEIILACELGSNEILCSDCFYRCYDELEPIPLTAEILEKNGWVNKEERGWMQKGNFGNSPLMLWYVKDIGKFNPHFVNELEMSDLSKDGGFRLKIQCKYVHELQHALRLCGLDELADNFKL